jgi:hypothetical protein
MHSRQEDELGTHEVRKMGTYGEIVKRLRVIARTHEKGNHYH